jgi:hypothetical protein
MPAWDRRTPWRQGHTLTSEAAVALGLVENSAKSLAIVITHDCDLTQNPDVEPNVELITGSRVDAADGNFTHAKNPRRLHLPVQENDKLACIDLRATDKRLVPKQTLAAYLPDKGVTLTPNNKSVLQRWLAARYRRSAFPDEFDRRLQETGLNKRIAKILEPLGTYLIAVFFDVDQGEDTERKDPEDLYTLTIDLLYSSEHDPEVALKATEEAAALILKSFREACLDSDKGTWHHIELLDCQPISDEAMTYSMSLQLKKWNADYLSLRVEPEHGPTLAE